MTKEERAEKWFQSIPETEAIPIQTKMEICSQAAKRMAFIWLGLLGVECLFLFWFTGGELFNQVADFLKGAPQKIDTGVSHSQVLLFVCLS